MYTSSSLSLSHIHFLFLLCSRSLSKYANTSSQEVVLLLTNVVKQSLRKFICYQLELGKQLADILTECSSRHKGEMTTRAFSQNVGKLFFKQVIFRAQVGNRYPSSSFMQEPTERPLKVFRKANNRIVFFAKFFLLSHIPSLFLLSLTHTFCLLCSRSL